MRRGAAKIQDLLVEFSFFKQKLSWEAAVFQRRAEELPFFFLLLNLLLTREIERDRESLPPPRTPKRSDV